ncbi:hypothetical protein EBT31_23215 [bacterium]|nr:hypothetical protein [bacterium]
MENLGAIRKERRRGSEHPAFVALVQYLTPRCEDEDNNCSRLRGAPIFGTPDVTERSNRTDGGEAAGVAQAETESTESFINRLLHV